MIKDWAWKVVFMDGTKFCMRGLLNRGDRYYSFKILDRTGSRDAKVYIPLCNVKMIYEANPEDMDWPEDELFFEIVEHKVGE